MIQHGAAATKGSPGGFRWDGVWGEPLPQEGGAAPSRDGKEGSWVHGQVWRGDPAD